MATERLKRRAESDEEDYFAKLAEEECVQALAIRTRASIDVIRTPAMPC
jgi:hypothetical protein